MIGNPIKDAGWGGFLWRDQTILEELDKSGKSTRSKINRVSMYALMIVLATYLGLQVSMWTVVIGAVLCGLIYLARIHLMFPNGRISYGLVILFSIGMFKHSPQLAIPALLLAICYLTLEGEVLLLAGIGVAATAGASHWAITVAMGLVLLGCWLGYASKTNHMAPWMSNPFKKKTSLLEEPPRLPVGYYQAGSTELRKALKTNNGSISARHRGSVAERRTALYLRDFLPKGSMVFHDLVLPGADAANIDHLLITPHGVFVLDTKLFAGVILQKDDGTIVKKSSYGEQDMKGITHQMLWAQEAVQHSLRDVPVKAIVAIQRAEIDRTLVAETKGRENVAYMALEQVADVIRKFPMSLDETDMKRIADEVSIFAGNKRPVYSKKKQD